MSLCLVENGSSIGESPQEGKINKILPAKSLKVLGLENANSSDEEILERISEFVNPASIQAFVYDYFNNFYTLFLSDIESMCQLVGKKISLGIHKMLFLPLLDYFIIDNVYPSTTDDELRDTFRTFGNVFQVTNYHVLPNSSKFSHVLSGKREICFTLPGREREIFIPINVLHPPYRYYVRRLCPACLTEGHSILNCPDRDEETTDTKLFCESSSDSELDNILKTENIPGIHHSTSSKELVLYKGIPEISSTERLKRRSASVESSTESAVLMNNDDEQDSRSRKPWPSLTNDPDEPDRKKPCLENKMPSLVLENEDLNDKPPKDLLKSKAFKHAVSKKKTTPPHTDFMLSIQAEECVKRSSGVLPPNVLRKMLAYDGRKRSIILTEILNHSTDLDALHKQLEKLYRKYMKLERWRPIIASNISKIREELNKLLKP